MLYLQMVALHDRRPFPNSSVNLILIGQVSKWRMVSSHYYWMGALKIMSPLTQRPNNPKEFPFVRRILATPHYLTFLKRMQLAVSHDQNPALVWPHSYIKCVNNDAKLTFKIWETQYWRRKPVLLLTSQNFPLLSFDNFHDTFAFVRSVNGRAI